MKKLIAICSVSVLFVLPLSAIAKVGVAKAKSKTYSKSPSRSTSTQSSGPTAAETEQALKDTQNLLTNPEERQKALEKDPKAKHADDMVQQISGNNPAMTEEIYALASKVFATLTEQAKGDPKVMEELLLKFQRDPASFVGTWTDEQRAQLKEISKSIESPSTQPKK